MANVIQRRKIQPLSRKLLRSLLLRGGHHLLGSGDVLAAGQGADLSARHLLLVDLYSLWVVGREREEGERGGREGRERREREEGERRDEGERGGREEGGGREGGEREVRYVCLSFMILAGDYGTTSVPFTTHTTVCVCVCVCVCAAPHPLSLHGHC